MTASFVPAGRAWLRNARVASRAGEYAQALELYEQFFEHALDDDPSALYGVRLSYCLNEWVKLGRTYPPALDRLAQASDQALRLLETTREPERFHDFVAICRHLGYEDEPIRRFSNYHARDSELAKSIVRFIWDALVAAKEWQLCGAYLGDPVRRYESALAKFDDMMRLSESDPELGGQNFDRQIAGWYVREVSNLILVLKNTGRNDDASSILERAVVDTRSRSRDDLFPKIQEHTNL